ncbi:hypothetical protein PG996_001980 [Apiospora saccharicola]|uniref:Rhodopsin domain-containing protein n=1 Tax=Apiospora saccharicola TaxID=335842 RepID=A0ABR1WI61_9PEZI
MVGSAELVANLDGAYNNLDEPQPAWNRRSNIISITVSVQLHYVGMGTFVMSSVCVKLALLFQYLRIFPDRPQMTRLCQGLIVFTVLYGTVISFIAWFPCFPPVALWDTSRPPGRGVKCYGFGASTAEGLYHTFVTVTGTNVLLNLVILVVAIPLYSRKGIDARSRWCLTAMLIMGGFVNTMAIWRLVHVQIMWARSGAYPTFDPTWYAPTTVMLAVLEVNGATVCAAIPIAGSRLPRPPPFSSSSSPSPSMSSSSTSSLGGGGASKGIMVTRDIRIDRTLRCAAVCDHHVMDSSDRDRKYDPGLCPSSPSGWRLGGGGERRSSRADSKFSDVTITVKSSGSGRTPEVEYMCCHLGGAGSASSHYRDSFVRAQVDPLNTFGRVRSVITAGPSSDR